MYSNVADLDVKQAYALLTSTVVPRPIAWITTTDGNGHINIAPFSYFQALCSDPPMLTVSIVSPRDGGKKDTLRLLEQTGHCVVHLVEEHDLERMNATSIELPPNESEADYAHIETTPWPGLPAVRITSSRVAFACTLVEAKQYGRNLPSTLVVLEVVARYLDPAVVDDGGAIDGTALKPVARLGGTSFGLLGERPAMPRPPRPKR